jgi:deoxyribodipyrimidine photolyase
MSAQPNIVWLHADNLNPQSPALQKAPNAPAIFVFDDALLQHWHISLKRILFIYECLLQLPVTIRRGDVAQEVAQFASEHNATQIYTNESPSPRHRQLCQQIVEQMPKGTRLNVLPAFAFADVDMREKDLKRFSRYWKVAKSRALKG